MTPLRRKVRFNVSQLIRIPTRLNRELQTEEDGGHLTVDQLMYGDKSSVGEIHLQALNNDELTSILSTIECGCCSHDQSSSSERQPCWRLFALLMLHLTSESTTICPSILNSFNEILATKTTTTTTTMQAETTLSHNHGTTTTSLILSAVTFYQYCNDVWNELKEKRRQTLRNRLISMNTFLSHLLFMQPQSSTPRFLQCVQELCFCDLKGHSQEAPSTPSSKTPSPMLPFAPSPSNSEVSNDQPHQSSKFGYSATLRVSNEEWAFALMDLPAVYSILIAPSSQFCLSPTSYLNNHSFNTYLAGILLSVWSACNRRLATSPSSSLISPLLISLSHRFVLRETSLYFTFWFICYLSNGMPQRSKRGTPEVQFPVLSGSWAILSSDVFSSLLPHIPTCSEVYDATISILRSVPSLSFQKQFLRSLWNSISPLIQLKKLPPSESVQQVYQATCPHPCLRLLTHLIFCDITRDSGAIDKCGLTATSHLTGGRIFDDVLQLLLEHNASDTKFIPLGFAVVECLFTPLHKFIRQFSPPSALNALSTSCNLQANAALGEYDADVDECHMKDIASSFVLPSLLVCLRSVWGLLQRIWADGTCISINSHVAVTIMIASFYRNARELTELITSINQNAADANSTITIEIIKSAFIFMKDDVLSNVRNDLTR